MKTRKITTSIQNRNAFDLVQILGSAYVQGHDLTLELEEGCRYVSPGVFAMIEAYSYAYEKKGIELKIQTKPESTFSKVKSLFTKNYRADVLEHQRKTLLQLQRCMNSGETNLYANRVIEILQDQVKHPDLAKALCWIVAEIADNAGVHGYGLYKLTDEAFPDPVFISAIVLGDDVEIAIIDLGKGIVNTLKKWGKPEIKRLRGHEILVKALEKGVTGHPVWSPGFGLFGSSQLIGRAEGEICIFSYDHFLIQKGNEAMKTKKIKNFPGSALLITVPLNSVITISDIIKPASQDMMDDLFT